MARSTTKELTSGSPMKLILGFAVPLLFGMLFQQFYSLMDTIIVGRYLGVTALAAVGATGSINFLIIGFCQGICNGFGLPVAQRFGARDYDGVRKYVGNSAILSVLIGGVLTALTVIFCRQILVLMQTPSDIIDLSYNYIVVIFAGIPAIILYNILSSYLRSLGDSITPVIFLIVAAVLNIGLDLLFVCVFHLGVAGAAWATILSQYGSFACCFIYMRKRYDILLFGKKDCHLKRDMVKEMLSIGFSMGFMNSLINIGSVALQGAINSLQDTNYIVAHTAARKITEVFMLPFSVFGTTMATFCGQNLGAGKNDRIKKGLWRVIWITWAWCTGMIILAYTVAPVLVHLITDTTQVKVIATASLYLRMNTILYFIPAVICILRNAMQGIGDSITPVISSSLELLCKVLVAVFLTPYLGYWAIIWSEPISWVIMVIPLLIRIANNPVLKGNQTN